HVPAGGGDAGLEEQPLGNVLVHGHGAAEAAAPGVGHVHHFEQGLQRAVLTGPAVEREKQDVGFLDCAELAQPLEQETTLERPELLDGRRFGPNSADYDPRLVLARYIAQGSVDYL